VSLQRRKPLARGKALARSTRLAPVNRKRRAKVFERNFGQRAAEVRSLGCIVGAKLGRELDDQPTFGHKLAVAVYHQESGQACDFGGAQAAHARARGMGGCKGDRRDLVPLCHRHHLEAGEFRTTQRTEFEKRYGIDLVAEADRIARALDAEGFA
jgi:hypothetical protein